MAVLRYDNDACVEIELANGSVPGEFGTPQANPLRDVAAAAAYALGEPLDYPPLAQSITPVDRIVVALDRAVPQAAQLTAALVHALVRAGVDADGITVLRSPADCDGGAEDPCRLLDGELRCRVTLAIHDPANRRQLAYLAANEQGEAILLSRTLHEADVVLSIGCLLGERSAGYFGIHGGIYPGFSDEKTLQRFRGLGSLNGRGTIRRDRSAEADRVAWLLGVEFTVQVVPGAGDGILHVLAGQCDAVRRRGNELYRAAWDYPVARRAELVIAAIEGGPAQQTWENVGRALQAAGSFVADGGSIALCCGLAAQPGPGVQHLSHAASREAALHHISHHRPIDALPAALLAHALDRNRIYLLSRLDPSIVEELEMVPLEGPDELSRLARRYASCTLVSNAAYVTATGEG